jgi:methylmalonyl-CoA mutase, N-terminal domain
MNRRNGRDGQIDDALAAWEAETLEPALAKMPERKPTFESEGGIEIKRLYTPNDLSGNDYLRDQGLPGTFPYTRGVYPSMYRGRPWTIRPYSGFGTAAETNKRFKYLLAHNQTGLTIAFDLPTQIGYDSDHPQAEGAVGRVGVTIDSIEDMHILFDGIPIEDVSVAMTINATAPIILAFYLAAAEEREVPFERLAGTTQNDILKEYVARGTYIYPVRPSLRMTVDLIDYCFGHVPKWNTLSITGVHMREAGATAIQEVAFTLAHSVLYIEEALKRGMDIDAFAPRLSYSLGCYRDLFEEVAKFRAARRLFAKEITRRFEPKDPRSSLFRIYCGTLGSTLTRQEPENNIVRIAMHALIGALGGAQAIFTASLDEAFALPTERTARIAVRTQQMMLEEFGITQTTDPLGGSYYVESLTDEIERRAKAILDEIDDMGGTLVALESGWIQRSIEESSYAFQTKVESGDHVFVAMNKYTNEAGAQEAGKIETFRVDPDSERRQRDFVRQVRSDRDSKRAQAAMERIEQAAMGGENLMPLFIEAAKARVTLGEICDLLRRCWGTYDPEQSY